uniref:Uncharacterized protein n=1 Tax=viral metagenome TaxID=1070528 RepID=A0A6C0JVN3_9ZZZZ
MSTVVNDPIDYTPLELRGKTYVVHNGRVHEVEGSARYGGLVRLYLASLPDPAVEEDLLASGRLDSLEGCIPAGDYEVPFGVYKGKTLDEIHSFDKHYIAWLGQLVYDSDIGIVETVRPMVVEVKSKMKKFMKCGQNTLEQKAWWIEFLDSQDLKGHTEKIREVADEIDQSGVDLKVYRSSTIRIALDHSETVYKARIYAVQKNLCIVCGAKVYHGGKSRYHKQCI